MRTSPPAPAGLFVALVARHTVQHKTRTLITIASVAVGVSVVVAVAVANRSAIASFEGSARYVSGDAAIEAVTDGAGFKDGDVARVRAVPGVDAVSPVVAGSATDPSTSDAYDLIGIDFLAATGPAVNMMSSANGHSHTTAHVFDRGAIVMSASMASRLRARLGATVPMLVGVRAVRFVVAGILDDDAMPLGARGTLFCDLSTAQESLGRVGRIDRIDIVPAARVDIAQVRSRLLRALPHGARLSSPSDATSVVEKMTDAFRFNLGALATIALLVGGFLVFNAVSMSVVQRRAEVGIARAVGATRRAILAVFLLEGAAVGLIGSLCGLLIGRALAGTMLHVVAGTIDALYAGTNPLGVAQPAIVYVGAAVVGTGTALAASLLPALEAASVQPSIALRVGSWEHPKSAPMTGLGVVAAISFAAAWIFTRLGPIDGRPVFGYAAALAALAGFSLVAPLLVSGTARVARLALPSSAGAPLQLAPSNLSGRTRRNAVAVASLMIGVAMTVSVSTMIASFRSSVQTWVGATLRGDLFVRPVAAVNADDVTMPDKLAAVARRTQGVRAVDVVRSKLIDVAGRPAFVGASDMRVTSTLGYLPLIDGGNWTDVGRSLVGGKAALVSEPFARKFGVRRGDLVTLAGSGRPVSLRISGVYEDYSSDTGFVFLDIATFRRLFGDDGINGIAVYARPGVDIAALRGRVERALSANRIVVQTNAQLRSQALAQFDRTFKITSVLDAIAVAVALMGVIATLAALVLERRREIGLLRCLGMTRGQVRSMIVAEALLLGIMGGALGIAAGYALAAILVFVINPQAFGWTIGFQATPVFDGALVFCVAIVSALAGLIPAASAGRISVADAIRAE